MAPPQRAGAVRVAALLGAPEATMGACGRAVVDDLCLLDGVTLVLVAGAVAHPNRWLLTDKLGANLGGVHAPVPGYQGRLAGQVERVLSSLRPGRALARRSWALLDDPTLHQPVATRALDRFDPTRLWLRVERQALRRLPATGAVVFAIRTRQWRIDALAGHPDQAAGLAASLRSTPDDLALYKGVDAIRSPLLAWLDAMSAGGVGGLPPTGGPQAAPPPRSLSAAEGGSIGGGGTRGEGLWPSPLLVAVLGGRAGRRV